MKKNVALNHDPIFMGFSFLLAYTQPYSIKYFFFFFPEILRMKSPTTDSESLFYFLGGGESLLFQFLDCAY